MEIFKDYASDSFMAEARYIDQTSVLTTNPESHWVVKIIGILGLFAGIVSCLYIFG